MEIAEIQRLCHDNPAKIFGVQIDTQTTIEIDETEEWTVRNEKLFTKAKWSPFAGWKMKGKVKRVIIKGTKVFENDTILAQAGFGTILT
jgi:dihydroorotase-like cyclic amidohydrolase